MTEHHDDWKDRRPADCTCESWREREGCAENCTPIPHEPSSGVEDRTPILLIISAVILTVGLALWIIVGTR